MPIAHPETMVGSDVVSDPCIVEGPGAMNQNDMEDRLENLDLRCGRIEQILPTLATKDDLAQLESRQKALTESVLDRMNVLFDGLDTRVSTVETRLGRVETRLGRVEVRLERVGTRLGGLETRLASVETDTKGIQYTLDRLVQRLEARNVI
jgi:chromosome segregation ATPase